MRQRAAPAVLCWEGVIEGVANAEISDRRGAGRRFRHDGCRPAVGTTAPAGAEFQPQRRRPTLAVADAAADARRGRDADRRARSCPGQAHRDGRLAGGGHGKIERGDCGVPRRGVQRSVCEDSSNLKLAMVFDSRNVSFEDVVVGGTQVGASVLFPKDAKHRLEIWWANPASRSGTYLILINKQSTWSAPDGLKLGLTLAELEKINRKPFKLKGFDKDNTATVSDWDGGTLSKIPGDCKSGVSLQPDPKTSPDAVKELTADKEYSSSDPAMREVKPKVTEILNGY